jgi:hypothetical protein
MCHDGNLAAQGRDNDGGFSTKAQVGALAKRGPAARPSTNPQFPIVSQDKHPEKIRIKKQLQEPGVRKGSCLTGDVGWISI